MKYEYDTNGVYFHYFLLSLLGLFLIPTTYGYIQKITPKSTKDDGAVTVCRCDKCLEKKKYSDERTKRTLKNPRISKKFIAWVVGWIAFVILLEKVIHAEVEPSGTVYDPYAILELDSSSTEEQIRKKYKQLSLKLHPDKNKDKEAAQEKFVQVSKAYQALTDDEVRKNWEEYGNPDGKQTFSFGIALPSWIVEPSNTIPVLAVYAALFGFLLPYFVGKWWSQSKKFTKDHVLNYTMGIYFQEFKEGMNVKRMLELLCASMEFKEDVPYRGERDREAVMALFRAVKDAVYSKTGERLELPKKFNAPYCFKAFTIVHAHLFRVPIEDTLLQEDAYLIIPNFQHLAMKGLLQIATAHFWLQQSLHCVEVSRMIIQAVPSSWNHMESSELMQLPHFNAALVKHLRNRKKPIKTIAQFMVLSWKERSDIMTTGGLNDSQISDVIAVAREYPIVTIDKAYFECVGEEFISPNSLATFVLRLKARNHVGEKELVSEAVTSDGGSSIVTSPTTKKKKSGSEPTSPTSDTSSNNDFVLGDDDEDGAVDDDGQPKRSSKLTKLLSGSYWQNPNKPVHCPFYPELQPNEELKKRPSFLMWLSNPRNNRVVGSPILINNLVPKTAAEDSSENGYRVAKFRFQAPTQVGTYQFTVVVTCDSYIGMELRQDVRMVVKDVPKVDEEKREKMIEQAWMDLEEEERMDREMGLTGGFGAPNPTTLQQEDDSSDSDDSDADSDEDSDSD